ncbi:MAG: hypothetical protein Q8Q69_07650 [Nitrosopumilaceae archaeon]|nr:hypothetical protein [Nitrosopumilaceae archaeon]MDP3781043.1 hypothetical protein [Nitrosopumilaceae archaeon]
MSENLPQRECVHDDPKTIKIQFSNEAEYYLCESCAKLDIFCA